MKIENMTETISLPDGVKATFAEEELKVVGPLGAVTRQIRHPPFTIEIGAEAVTLTCSLASRKEKPLLGTWRAHISNMVKGVTEGFEYKLKMVFAHFPVKLSLKPNEMVIENFLGERFPRRAHIIGDTKADISDQIVTLTGLDKEAVGQSAANLERATKIKGFDPRVFQDGFYIISKG